jgi:Glycosyl hydrolase family 59
MNKSVLAGALALVVTGGSASMAAVTGGGHAVASALPVTNITVNGSGTGRAYDGIGAVLGGGGNARYLMDYPAAQRDQILDYLFKPGFGASLQLLKLEIGGGTNSSDGSEPSIDPTGKKVNCGAGYEFAIAKRAVKLDPSIKLYGLQWSAPGWVGNSVFTQADRTYLLQWLGCAKKAGLTISYLGGWNENDNGGKHRTWWAALRSQLDKAGFRSVKLVAGDSQWAYSDPNDSSIQILGAHDICGFPTGSTAAAKCSGPKLPAKGPGSAKTAWASEIGGDDAGAQAGCTQGAKNQPCAPGMVRALVRGYRAKLTGYLEWPVLDAMPAQGLPYEDRGLITADQPWSGDYSVNAMTWATAQFTQVTSLPSKGHPGWHYIDQAGTGFLQGNPADGSYVTLVRDDKKAWSTIIETTAATTQQNVTFTVSGGASGLASDPVHVWTSDFDPASSGDNPSGWFQPMAHPIAPVNGKFTLTLQPGWVYSLTTTTGQGNGTTSTPQPPPASSFPLPYDNGSDLAGPGQAGSGNDDEPQFLAAQDGSFELKRCVVAFGGNSNCTEQTTRAVPVFWHGAKTQAARYPYAIIGDESLQNYTVSVDALLTQPGTSAGLIGRFSVRNFHAGYFDGYIFDVSTTGAWRLIKNNTGAADSVANRTVASGKLAPLALNTWHLLSMSLSGNTITLSVDTHQVRSYTDEKPWRSGLAGLEAGAFTHAWPQAQYSDLSITSLSTPDHVVSLMIGRSIWPG